MVSKLLTDFDPVFLGQSQHLVICIDANHASMRSHNLRPNVTDLSSTRTEIKYHIAFSDETRRIPATVISFPDLIRNHIKKSRVVLNRTTELLFSLLRC